MGIRRLAYPTTMLQNTEQVLKQQSAYDGGMNSDTPPSEILPNEASDLFNLIAFPQYCQNRPGCAVMSALNVPVEAGYYTASKDGNVVSLYGPSAYDFVAGEY